MLEEVRGGAPEFPLQVRWSTGEVEVFDDLEHLRLNLEWFDSDDISDGGKDVVVDARGREVRLLVEKLEVLICELE